MTESTLDECPTCEGFGCKALWPDCDCCPRCAGTGVIEVPE